jgi:hypothetical protein
MFIELMEFYPIKIADNFITGTLQINIPTLSIKIQGIFCLKKENKWYFNLPGQNGINSETQKKCRYTYIMFQDDLQKLLIKEIKDLAPEFIQHRIKNTSRPLIFTPVVKKIEKKPPFKKTNLTPKSVLTTKWSDPPKPKYNRPVYTGKKI